MVKRLADFAVLLALFPIPLYPSSLEVRHTHATVPLPCEVVKSHTILNEPSCCQPLSFSLYEPSSGGFPVFSTLYAPLAVIPTPAGTLTIVASSLSAVSRQRIPPKRLGITSAPLRPSALNAVGFVMPPCL